MTNKDKRHATQVLLDVEAKLDTVIRQNQVLDINVKRILNCLNLANMSLKVDPPDPGSSIDYDFPPAVQPKPVQQPVQSTQPPKPVQVDAGPRKSIVQQRVVYNDSRPVILAEVIVADGDVKTNILSKVRTDAHGKWHASLYAGKYLVTVKKGPTAVKPGFKIDYEITIPAGGKPVELERKQAI